MLSKLSILKYFERQLSNIPNASITQWIRHKLNLKTSIGLIPLVEVLFVLMYRFS